MHGNHMMIDLETLDTSSKAVVTNIGVSIFDASTVVPTNNWDAYPQIEEQVLIGKRRIKWDTLCFWNKQSDEARSYVFTEDAARQPTWSLLKQIQELWLENQCVGVWGHGSVFDIAIMDSLYLDFDMDAPWGHRAVFDTRTMALMYPDVDKPPAGVKHRAVDDAIAQAIWVARMMREHTDMMVLAEKS